MLYYENEILFDNFYYKNYLSLIDKNDKEIKSSIIYSILKDCLVKNQKDRFNIEDLYSKYYDLIKNL